jgi:hypothetical protein
VDEVLQAAVMQMVIQKSVALQAPIIVPPIQAPIIGPPIQAPIIGPPIPAPIIVPPIQAPIIVPLIPAQVVTAKSKFTLRRSALQYKGNYTQNLIWPANPDYNNPIVAIWNKTNDFYFSFALKSGEKSYIDTTGMVSHRFDPDSVKKVTVRLS